jgi:hypothetical protein
VPPLSRRGFPRPPDGRSCREGAFCLGKHQQHAFYAEFEDDFGVKAAPHVAVTFGQDPGAYHVLHRRVGHLPGPADQGEAVVLPRWRASLAVQRVAPPSFRARLLATAREILGRYDAAK